MGRGRGRPLTGKLGRREMKKVNRWMGKHDYKSLPRDVTALSPIAPSSPPRNRFSLLWISFKEQSMFTPEDVLPTSHILDNSVSLHVQRHHSPSKNRVGSPGICIYPLHSHLPQSVLTLSSERVLRNHDKHPRAEVYLPSLVWKAKAIVRGSLQQLQH